MKENKKMVPSFVALVSSKLSKGTSYAINSTMMALLPRVFLGKYVRQQSRFVSTTNTG